MRKMRSQPSKTYSAGPLHNGHAPARDIYRRDIHTPQGPRSPVPCILRHGRPVGEDGEPLDDEPADADGFPARGVEELRQLALRDGGDGGREPLDPDALDAEAVEGLEGADAEEAAADALGAEAGQGHVADAVGDGGGVGVRLVRLGVELVHADEGRVAAVGGVARVDDVDVGDGDVFERAGRPAELDRRGGGALPDGDAVDADVGVVGFDGVVVGVVEDVADRGPGVVLRPVRLAEEGADLLVVGHPRRERGEVAGEVHGVEGRGVDGDAGEDEGLRVVGADAAPHPEPVLVGLFVAVARVDVRLVDVLLA